MTKNSQLTFDKVGSWGGKRRGAGRKNLSGQVNHMRRAKVDPRYPMHITIRLTKGAPNLRRKHFVQIFAVGVKAAKQFGLRVVHFSILGNHLHLIVEAKSNQALSRGMQSLKIRLGKSLVKFWRDLGNRNGVSLPKKVAAFSGRYHVEIVKSPQYMWNTLKYVMLNEFRHARAQPKMSVFSSIGQFNGRNRLRVSWSQREIEEYQNFWEKTVPLSEFLSVAQSWLGREGWKVARV